MAWRWPPLPLAPVTACSGVCGLLCHLTTAMEWCNWTRSSQSSNDWKTWWKYGICLFHVFNLRSITLLKPHRSNVFICHHFLIHALEYKLHRMSSSHVSWKWTVYKNVPALFSLQWTTVGSLALGRTLCWSVLSFLRFQLDRGLSYSTISSSISGLIVSR